MRQQVSEQEHRSPGVPAQYDLMTCRLTITPCSGREAGPATGICGCHNGSGFARYPPVPEVALLEVKARAFAGADEAHAREASGFCSCARHEDGSIGTKHEILFEISFGNPAAFNASTTTIHGFAFGFCMRETM